MKDLSVTDDRTLTKRSLENQTMYPENKNAAQIDILPDYIHPRQIELETQNRKSIKTQRSLEQARDKFALLYDFAPVGYITFDEEGCIRESNLTACKLLGMEHVNLIGKPFSVFLHNDDVGTFFNHIKEVFLSQQKVRDELTIKSINGNRTPVRIESISYNSHEATVLCQTAIIDISELKQEQEKMLQRLNLISHESRLMMIGQMTSEIAHEINQPLAAIGNYTSAGIRMHDTGKMDYQTSRDILEKIQTQVKRVSQIIQHLRKFSQKRELMFEELELNDLICDLLKLVDAEQHWHGITLEKLLAEDKLFFNGDPILLQQAILNILRNALESLSQAGTDKPLITIGTSRENQHFIVRITDNGPGIQTGLTTQIFQPFITTKDNGLGLGLSIANSIVDAHHGNILLKKVSNSLTTFDIVLPIQQAT